MLKSEKVLSRARSTDFHQWVSQRDCKPTASLPWYLFWWVDSAIGSQARLLIYSRGQRRYHNHSMPECQPLTAAWLEVDELRARCQHNFAEHLGKIDYTSWGCSSFARPSQCTSWGSSLVEITDDSYWSDCFGSSATIRPCNRSVSVSPRQDNANIHATCTWSLARSRVSSSRSKCSLSHQEDHWDC